MRILSSVFLIEIFDLRGNELKYANEMLLNHHRNYVKSHEAAGLFSRDKTAITNHLPNMPLTRIHMAA